MRDCQVKPVQLALQEQDQFVVLPTGGGKTAVYIVPTLCCGFSTLIFSPLVSLIKDQLEGLLRMGLRARGVSSNYPQTMNDMALRDWSVGGIDFLLVAPERIENEGFKRAMRVRPPNFVVVDEIHVASEHAFNFRPSYRKIAPFVREMNPSLFLGLTATMPVTVEDDLRTIFGVPDIKKTSAYYARTNLRLESREWHDNFELLRQVNSIKGSTIVYFSSVRRLEAAYEAIGARVTGGACAYHGQIATGTKASNQNMFMDDSVRVVFATNSFGMGVDKSDVRGVIFATIPSSLEELLQGFGRGGRDGEDCRCIYYYNEESLSVQNFFIETGYPARHDVVAFVRAIEQRIDPRDGLCYATIRELLEAAGVNGMLGKSLTTILASEGVIERIRSKKPLRVRPLKVPGTKVQASILEAITDLGARDDRDGFYAVDIDFLGDHLQKPASNVLNSLRAMERKDVVALEDPGNTNPIKLCKSVHEIDFDKIRKRRDAALANLQAVQDFWRVPDEKKHQTLDAIFQN